MEMQSLIDMLIGLFVAGGAWWANGITKEQKRIEILLNKTREEMAKEYVTKQEVKDDMARVFDTLDKIEEKLDKLFEVK